MGHRYGTQKFQLNRPRGDRFVRKWLQLRVNAWRCERHFDERITPDYLRTIDLIVVANHVSLLDGVLIALASPVPLTFAVDPDYARHSRLAMAGMRALSRLGFGQVVPLGSSAPFALRALRNRLHAGEAVMLFPEGAIRPGTAPLPEQPGVAWLSHWTGAATIHIEIGGAEQSRLFAKAGTRWWPAITLAFRRRVEVVR